MNLYDDDMSEREGKDLNEQIENNYRGIREMRKRRRKNFHCYPA